jgi:alpha-tubulin suppressor-like RCC1 family protein
MTMRKTRWWFVAMFVVALVACGKSESGSSAGKGGVRSSEPWVAGMTPAKTEPVKVAPATKAPSPAPTKTADAGTAPAPTPTPTPTPAAKAEPKAQVCAGGAYTCAMKASGEVLCFGDNLDGQLGDGTAVNRSLPVPVVGVSDATRIACGWAHTCVLRRAGGVACWGANDHGELGNGSKDPTQVPVDAAGLTDVAELAAGQGFTCARRNDGHVLCWGAGSWGRLGNGKEEDSATPVDVSDLADAQQIAAGRHHACALRKSGEVVCWGYGYNLQLGRGDDTSNGTTPAAVAGLTGVQAVAAGDAHTCALLQSGAVKCWGRGNDGELGQGQDGDAASSGAPVDVADLAKVTTLALGAQRSCALLDSGEVRCWGYNNYGTKLLGVDSEERVASKPLAVKDLAGVTGLAAGGEHACALVDGTKVACWGGNGSGQRGSGDATWQAAPNTAIEDLAKAAPEAPKPYTFEPSPDATVTVVPHISHGRDYACGVTPDGKVLCFGSGAFGQLGSGSTASVPATAARIVPGLTDVVQVAAGLYRTCARRANGRVACWGNLGKTLTSLPMPIDGIEDAAEIAVGGSADGIFACVRHAGGTVSCWGEGSSGQLGSETTASSDAPVQIADLDDVKAIALALATACAVRENGKVVCWGSSTHGELGNGSTESSSTPVEVRGLSRVTLLVGEGYDFCAVHSNGKLSCWGSNEDGQIGNGSANADSPATKPSEVRGLRNVVSVGLGGDTACAIAKDGKAFCWGANTFGQTGHDDTETERVTRPWDVLREKDETVKGFGPYVMFDCENNSCCGLHVDGHVSCMGVTPIGGEPNLFGIGELRSPFPVAAAGVQLAPTPED